MSVETEKELDDFLRNLRQSYNSRDMKAFRAHFWTDKRFVHIDAAGRIDEGWGAFEEILDQEFRYLDTARLELRDVHCHAFEDRFAAVSALYKIEQIDPDGRSIEQNGRVSFSVVRMRDDWKIVSTHYSVDPQTEY